MKEIWKKIEGCNDFYYISNKGRVKSYNNRGKSRLKNPIILKNHKRNSRYLGIDIGSGSRRNKPNKRIRFMIHRLVAQMFIPNVENKLQVNHKDGNKLNNCVDNLEWCTSSENIKHSFLIGTHKANIGERHPMAKLKSYQVLEIRNLHFNSPFLKNIEIAEKFKISVSLVRAIISRRLWKHI